MRGIHHEGTKDTKGRRGKAGQKRGGMVALSFVPCAWMTVLCISIFPVFLSPLRALRVFVVNLLIAL